jgi:beta-galactosidase
VVSFTQRADTAWAARDAEVAWADLPLAFAAKPRAKKPVARPKARAADPFGVEERGDAMHLRNERVELVIDRATARLATLGWNGAPLLLAGPEATLWRAPTDNDGLKQGWMRGKTGKLAAWLEWGLDRLERRGLEVLCKPSRDGSLRVRLVAELVGADASQRALHREELTIDASGAIRAVETIEVPKAWDDLPRIGVRLRLPGRFAHLEWFGLGPHETYPDRRAGGRSGRFDSTIAAQYVPYVVPQEHGHHTDSRGLVLADARGAGVRIAGPRRFGFSASQFRTEDLWAARHTIDLTPRDEVELHLDAAHRGLGTASCGPDVLPRYRVGAGRHRLAWSLTDLAATSS